MYIQANIISLTDLDEFGESNRPVNPVYLPVEPYQKTILSLGEKNHRKTHIRQSNVFPLSHTYQMLF